MKFSAGVLAAIAAPMAAMAFMQPSVTSKGVFREAFDLKSRLSQEQFQRSKAMTELQMAFNLKEGQVSNMFEGPAPLVKERDACGVGFIANTSSGGKIVERGTKLLVKAILLPQSDVSFRGNPYSLFSFLHYIPYSTNHQKTNLERTRYYLRHL